MLKKLAAVTALTIGLTMASAAPAIARPGPEDPDSGKCYVGMSCKYAGAKASGSARR